MFSPGLRSVSTGENLSDFGFEQQKQNAPSAATRIRPTDPPTMAAMLLIESFGTEGEVGGDVRCEVGVIVDVRMRERVICEVHARSWQQILANMHLSCLTQQ